MLADLIEILLLVVRGALIAGMCWGAWLSLGERFATVALIVLLLTTFGGLAPAA